MSARKPAAMRRCMRVMLRADREAIKAALRALAKTEAVMSGPAPGCVHVDDVIALLGGAT